MRAANATLADVIVAGVMTERVVFARSALLTVTVAIARVSPFVISSNLNVVGSKMQ